MHKIFFHFLDRVLKPHRGLPRHLFHLISMLSPVVNVEAIVTDIESACLVLIYRDDEFYGPGWHLPGGIVRSRETMCSRIVKMVKAELNLDVDDFSIESCVSIAESIDLIRSVRSHFVSFTFLIRVQSNFSFPAFRDEHIYANGDIAVHTSVPSNLISEHIKYLSVLEEILSRMSMINLPLKTTFHIGK